MFVCAEIAVAEREDTQPATGASQCKTRNPSRSFSRHPVRTRSRFSLSTPIRLSRPARLSRQRSHARPSSFPSRWTERADDPRYPQRPSRDGLCFNSSPAWCRTSSNRAIGGVITVAGCRRTGHIPNILRVIGWLILRCGSPSLLNPNGSGGYHITKAQYGMGWRATALRFQFSSDANFA